MKKPIQMVDLQAQYKELADEIQQGWNEVLAETRFIGGSKVDGFARGLEQYLGVKHVIPCANGTDALQIAMMALGLKQGDEVIVPAFTYVATAEVIALLGLVPVLVDVDLDTYNISISGVKLAITPKTKAIVPVHLFGQCADIEPLMQLAEQYGLFVIEDNAQAIGATYRFADGSMQKAGSIGHFGCTSFFPSKNLGCYGDGGALMTNDDAFAEKARMIANHGQTKLYYHDLVGVNSRLDALQAVVLSAKLPRLDSYNRSRASAARVYDETFGPLGIDRVVIPQRAANTSHVYHQYTMRLVNTDRDSFRAYMQACGVPTMVYYPVPLYEQGAYQSERFASADFPNTEILCREVVSLPMHAHFDAETLQHICGSGIAFFAK
jgi:UDP-2-acetamido-2-deoxy-ribo-hexuluronate aminotransferase